MTIWNIYHNLHWFFSVAITVIIIITTIIPKTPYQYYSSNNNNSGFVLVPFVITILRIALIVLLAHVNAWKVCIFSFQKQVTCVGWNIYLYLVCGKLINPNLFFLILMYVPCIFYYLLLWPTNAQLTHNSYMFLHYRVLFSEFVIIAS